MIKSMTGYGRGSSELESRTLTIELRSINSRYLEIHTRFPREYAELEGAAKSRIKESVRRGRVDISLTLESSSGNPLHVNMTLVESYVRVCRQIQEQFGLTEELSVAGLLQIPGIIEIEGGVTAAPLDTVKHVFDAALQQAMDGLLNFRQVEGSSLAAELRERLQSLASLLGQIESRSTGLLQHYHQRLATRMRELLGDGMAGEDRIALEAAIYAEKSDIREEVVRMHSHIDQFNTLIANDGEVGKQLDFLLQEMNREANTILSKAGPAGIAQLGVQMKSEIEKLREQVQNIE